MRLSSLDNNENERNLKEWLSSFSSSGGLVEKEERSMETQLVSYPGLEVSIGVRMAITVGLVGQSFLHLRVSFRWVSQMLFIILWGLSHGFLHDDYRSLWVSDDNEGLVLVGSRTCTLIRQGWLRSMAMKGEQRCLKGWCCTDQVKIESLTRTGKGIMEDRNAKWVSFESNKEMTWGGTVSRRRTKDVTGENEVTEEAKLKKLFSWRLQHRSCKIEGIWVAGFKTCFPKPKVCTGRSPAHKVLLQSSSVLNLSHLRNQSFFQEHDDGMKTIQLI